MSAARRDLAAEARRKPRGETSVLAKQSERRQRAQRFLRDELARGPKRVSDDEEAAEKAHIDEQLLAQARAGLGVTTTSGSAGGGKASPCSGACLRAESGCLDQPRGVAERNRMPMGKFFKIYQTLIVGWLGFLGVWATLWWNGRLQRQLEERRERREADARF